MPAVKTLSDRIPRPILLLLSMAFVALCTSPFAAAQTSEAIINQSAWQMMYGINPASVSQATWNSWLANQLPAGTNPLAPNSQLQVSTFTSNSTTVSLTFPTVAHKQYVLQATSSLSSPNWVNVSGQTVNGDGTNKTLTANKSAGSFFKVLVQDISTAGDGVSDWAKAYLGYTIGTPISGQTSYTAATLATAMSTQNVVTLSATDPTATQPASGTATDLASVTVTRAGYQSVNAITVPLQITGTGTLGTDYTVSPASANSANGTVTIPAGVNSVPIYITPLVNAARLSSTTVNVTAQAGAGYTLGTPSSASVLIYPNPIPSGTGLTGAYYAGSSATYNPGSASAPINLGTAVATYNYTKPVSGGQVVVNYSVAGSPATAYSTSAPNNLVNLQFLTGTLAGGTFDNNYTITAAVSPQFLCPLAGPGSSTSGLVLVYPFAAATGARTDSTVDFNWGTSTAPISGISAGAAFTVRWTGQVLATFTEPYYFSVNSTQGCKLWVNNQKIIDKWQTQGLTDQISTPINLQAGVFYDIKLEYLATAGNANEVHLQWYNNDFPEQVIPQANLYPNITGFGSAAAAAATSPISVAYLLGSGVPFTYTITGNNGTTTVTASNLPAWLTLSGNTLSGTPPAAGIYQFTITTTNSAGSSSAIVTINVVDPPGMITREIWTGLSGTSVASIPTTTNPTSTDTTLTTLEDTAAYANNTGERLRGYFTPPTTANYYFWIGGTNAGELWISDDNQKVNLLRRASFSSTTGSRTWNNQASQQSPWLSLVGGQKYYFEVLHNTGSSGASSNLSVAWLLDPTGSSGGVANGSGPALPASPGGIVSAAVLSPWDNPQTTNTAGSIYLANLAPTSNLSVATRASGGAYLSVNGSVGLLHLNAYGLTSGTTWRRVCTGPVASPTVLFDLDAQDKNYPANKTSDGGYTWNIASLPTLTGGQAYMLIATQSNPNGELAGTFNLAAGSQTLPAPPSYPSWTDDHTTVAGASRFLTQATFGPSPTDIYNFTNPSGTYYSSGTAYKDWIENQFTIGSSNPTLCQPYVASHLSNDPQNPYQSTLMFNAWWKNAVTAPDQLCQRVAFALSEILVVSDNNSPINNLAQPQAAYYDTLLKSCFTNFSTLLQNVTLSIPMGEYLNMFANSKGNTQTGLHPNENYGREIMQLFSIGLYKLWPDGTLVLDSNGNPIPTYNQSMITGISAAFTGWGWAQVMPVNGRLANSYGPVDWVDPMVLNPFQHDLNSKILLDNVILPASTFTSSSTSATGNPIILQTVSPTLGIGNLVNTSITNAYDLNGLIDLYAALNMLANHPNVGPFICRQLIQRLVESNPSPAYLYRVVQAFNGVRNVNGVATGVVGDLKETIRAILLDPEARNSSAALASTTIGKQREPLLRVTGPARTFLPTGISCTYRQLGGQAMMVNTPSAAHRLTNGDVVQLDNVVDLDGTPVPPPSQGYTVSNVTAAYSVSGTTATISSPGYQVGDNVNIQFLNGTLATNSTANVVTSYPVTGATYYNFTVTVPAGFSGASGNAFLPNNFTANSTGMSSGSFSNVGTTVTVTSAGHNVNDQIYLYFAPSSTTTGNIAGGTFNGVYTIQSVINSGSQFTVTLGSAPSTNTSGTVLWPQFTGGYSVTTSGSTQTVTFQTSGTNDLQKGDNVWINILVANSPNGLPSAGSYPIQDTAATNSSLAANEFTIQFTGTSYTTGTQSSNGYAAYPLTVSSWTRHGTATLNYSTFNLGYTAGFIQTPLDATTVFNYFYPDYHYPGALTTAGLTVPEFQITNATNVMTLTNSLVAPFPTSGGNNMAFSNYNSGAIWMDLSPFMSPSTSVATLVANLDNLLTGGYTNATTQNSIASYINTNVSSTSISSVSTGNPCTVNLATPHGLAIGTAFNVTISGVSGGTFSPSSINGTYNATVTTPTAFTVTGENCTVAPSAGTGSFLINTAGTQTRQVLLARVRQIVQFLLVISEYAIQK